MFVVLLLVELGYEEKEYLLRGLGTVITEIYVVLKRELFLCLFIRVFVGIWRRGIERLLCKNYKGGFMFKNKV